MPGGAATTAEDGPWVLCEYEKREIFHVINVESLLLGLTPRRVCQCHIQVADRERCGLFGAVSIFDTNVEYVHYV